MAVPSAFASTMRPLLFLFAVLLLLVALPAGAVRARTSAPQTPRFPILAWIGPPAAETSVERYRELANAGFTHNFSGFPNVEAMAIALDVAHNAGILQFVSLPELAADPEGVVARFKQHPALAGYHLRDEPSSKDFPALATWVKRIQAVDREHPCYINLFPTYASSEQLGSPTYREHLDTFLRDVPVPFLSYDHYPIVGDRLRGDYYENLEQAAAAAQARNVPLWAFVLATAHDPYPIPTPAHLRLQAFSDLAYGAQCIQYFTYWTPESTVWNFHQGPIEKDGKRTPTYDRVRQMNAEIQALAPHFLGAKLIRTGHTGSLPRGTREYAPEAPVAAVDTSDGGALVSLLEQGADRVLAVVNRDFQKPLSVTVRFDGSRRVARFGRDGKRARVRGRRVPVELEPGDIAVFRWPRDE